MLPFPKHTPTSTQHRSLVQGCPATWSVWLLRSFQPTHTLQLRKEGLPCFPKALPLFPQPPAFLGLF